MRRNLFRRLSALGYRLSPAIRYRLPARQPGNLRKPARRPATPRRERPERSPMQTSKIRTFPLKGPPLLPLLKAPTLRVWTLCPRRSTTPVVSEVTTTTTPPPPPPPPPQPPLPQPPKRQLRKVF